MHEITEEVSVAVIGAGTMGAGIAQVAAASGHKVFLYDLNPDAVIAGINGIAKGLQGQVARGKMVDSEVDQLLARIIPSSVLSDLCEAGLIVEAIVENLEIKQKLFSDLEEICNSNTIFASNTSSISITSIAAKLKLPERVVGMHFFNPAPILKLVEVISGVATSKVIASQVYNLAKAWGKSPVYARSTPGFIVNRVARPFYAEGLRVLEEGAADVVTIDTIMRESGGFRMGPFELMDLIGNDVNYSVTCSVFNAYYQDSRFKPSLRQLELVNAGFLGRKTGRGFYDYKSDGKVEVTNAACMKSPTKITINSESSESSVLIGLIKKYNLPVTLKDGDNTIIEVDEVTIVQTNGTSATELASNLNVTNLVVFDLALDYINSERIVLAKADQCTDEALGSAIGFFQALGKKVSVIDDVPGLVLMRTVCMLANEAADAVSQGVAEPKDVDIAMCKGVNYPRGPLYWANTIGIEMVFNVLNNLYKSYGEDRYRPSILLRRKAIGKINFKTS